MNFIIISRSTWSVVYMCVHVNYGPCTVTSCVVVIIFLYSLPTYETVKGPNDHEEELTDNPMYGQTQFSINGSFDRLTSDLSLYPKEENKYTQ